MCIDALRSRRILRRPFPRGASDPRRRSPARRRALQLRRRLGIHRRRPAAQAEQGAAHLRIRASRPKGATNDPIPQSRPPRAATQGSGRPHARSHRNSMKLIFHIWRQKDRASKGRMARYEKDGLNPDMSMLEALDVLNEDLILKGEDPITFEHDCREGICGSCGFVINGIAHGPLAKTTVCQLTLRHFQRRSGTVPRTLASQSLPRPARPDGGPQRLRPHHHRPEDTSASPPAAPPTATRFWSTRITPTEPWTPPPASAAEPV